MTSKRHVSVLGSEVVDIMAPKSGESILDLTLGLGGHASMFAEAIGPEGALVGVDADEENLNAAREKLSKVRASVELLHMNFMHVADLSDRRFDVIFADLGVSSPHFDDPSRGFTFRQSAPLDMRFDRSSGKTAADVIASSSESQLAEIFSAYGELPPYKLARCVAREKPTTTDELVTCVESVFGYKAQSLLPQVFQALRMRVNHEIEALDALLTHCPGMLNEGGRLGIISFHSLEDRMVKKAFAKLSEPEIDDVTGAVVSQSEFALLAKKPIMPTDSEVVENPRARSAKFRVLGRSVSRV